jgi:hypothetical protein
MSDVACYGRGFQYPDLSEEFRLPIRSVWGIIIWGVFLGEMRGLGRGWGGTRVYLTGVYIDLFDFYDGLTHFIGATLTVAISILV